jgi:hypothetical protein
MPNSLAVAMIGPSVDIAISEFADCIPSAVASSAFLITINVRT